MGCHGDRDFYKWLPWIAVLVCCFDIEDILDDWDEWLPWILVLFCCLNKDC